MITLGISSYEMVKINEKIFEMKQNVDHNDGRIVALNKLTKYNSGQIQDLINVQVHTNEILTKNEITTVKKY